MYMFYWLVNLINRDDDASRQCISLDAAILLIHDGCYGVGVRSRFPHFKYIVTNIHSQYIYILSEFSTISFTVAATPHSRHLIQQASVFKSHWDSFYATQFVVLQLLSATELLNYTAHKTRRDEDISHGKKSVLDKRVVLTVYRYFSPESAHTGKPT